MTYQEAIEVLKRDDDSMRKGYFCINDFIAIEVAIKALEELKMYKDGKLCLIPADVYAKQCEELDAYNAIGTVDECREAVEKQKAKKPISNDKCTCPSCGTHNEVIKKRRNTVANDIVYCWHCGQKVEIERLE